MTKEKEILKFQKIFEEYYPALVVFAKKYVIDLDTAREIVQNFFVKFYEKRNVLNINSSLKSYLYSSVKNSCLNYLKSNSIKQKHYKNISIQETESNDWSDKMEETELEEKIYRAVNDLPTQCSKIFKMNRFDGYSNKEIADKLNISKRTVETQISKALKKLREKFKDYIKILIFGFFHFFT